MKIKIRKIGFIFASKIETLQKVDFVFASMVASVSRVDFFFVLMVDSVSRVDFFFASEVESVREERARLEAMGNDIAVITQAFQAATQAWELERAELVTQR